MNYTKENHEYIERYLADELNNEEREAFQQKLKSNKEFKEQVIFYETVRQSTNELRKEELQTRFKKRRTRQTASLVIGIILIVATLTYFLLPVFGKPSIEEELFKRHSTPIAKDFILDENNQVQWQKVAYDPESMAVSEKILIQEGLNAFYDKSYDKAISALSPSVNLIPAARFYRGLSFFEKKNYIKAIEDFESTERQIVDNRELMYETRWYLALSYIKTKQLDKAKTRLKLLANSEKYQITADKIIQELSK